MMWTSRTADDWKPPGTSINSSYSPDASHGYALPEPVPDWPVAKTKWHWGWQIHTYGFGVLYALLAVYCVLVLVHLHRRLRIQQYIVLINGLMLVFSVCRSCVLLVDPYESVGCLPLPLLRVMYGVAFPCLTSSFSLVQMVFMRITKVQMGPQKLQNYRVLAAVITTHFSVVIVIDITVAYKNGLKLLILLCQSIFITWGLVLCFGFIYNGFRVAQFTNEANKALKQLITYSRIKQQTLKNGNRRELALHRINKPKIRQDSEERWAMNEDYRTSELESSDSMSFYNEAHLEFTEDALAKLYETRGKRTAGRRAGAHAGGRHGVDQDHTKLHLTTPTSTVDFSDSEELSESLSTYGPVSTEERCMTSMDNEDVSREAGKGSNGRSPSDPDPTNPRREGNTALSTSTSPLSTLAPRDSPKHAYVNIAFDFICNGDVGHSWELKDVVGTGRDAEEGDADAEEGGDEPEPDGHDEKSAVCTQESGYMADTELNSPRPQRKKETENHKKTGKKNKTQADKQEFEMSGSPKHEPYPLPASDGTLGLYRIRQGRTLKRALRVAYITTLFGFVCCVLQLYAMFGVYGTLSNEIPAEPWPWLLFHSSMR